MAMSGFKLNGKLPFVALLIALSSIMNGWLILNRKGPGGEPSIHAKTIELKKQEIKLSFLGQNSNNNVPGIKENKGPRVLSDQETVSACLLIKDDNYILHEWLAYHYHVLGLRYMLVAVDPSSETSPTPIFDLWRNYTDDMEIVEVSDKDFMPKEFLERGYHIPPRFIDGNANASKWHEGHEDPEQVIADNTRINNHRFRQLTFLSACLRHMRRKGRTLTMHIDTDEYVVLNPFLRRTSRKVNPHLMQLRVHSVGNANSVIDVLKQAQEQALLRDRMNYPCISLPRLLFGNNEKAEWDPSSKAPPGYVGKSFETLRWAYHTEFDDTERNAQPKVIVDVSQVPLTDEMFQPQAFSIHRPSKALCRRIAQMNLREPVKFPLSVNHYVGTWERYYARNDTRRSQRAYDFKAHVNAGRDTWIASWLGGFVRTYGRKKAAILLGPHLMANWSESILASTSES